jgi:hypothetical protein
MPKHVYSCLMADNMVTILCLRQGRWQPEPIAGETTTLIEGGRTVPAVLDALNDRLNLQNKLADVQVIIVYAQAAAALLSDAVKRLGVLGCTPSEILRLERLGPADYSGSATDIMDKLVSGSAPLLAARSGPHSPPPPPGARPAPPRAGSAKAGAARFFTVDPGSAHAALIYDSDSGLLWSSQAGTPAPLPAAQGAAAAGRLQLAGMTHWRVPDRHELAAFAAAPQPLLGKNGKTLLERWNWLCTEGRLDIVKNRLAPESDASGYLLPVLDLARGKSLAEFTELVRQRGWQIAPWPSS